MVRAICGVEQSFGAWANFTGGVREQNFADFDSKICSARFAGENNGFAFLFQPLL